MPPHRLVTVSDLDVDRGGRRVLWDVSLGVDAGEIVTIVGPNGSGKSTLVSTIIGAVPATAGRVERREGLRVGYVPQSLHLTPGLPMTVARFLALSPGGHGNAAGALARTGAEDLADRQLGRLSGGQRQRVLLARAIRSDPHLLILDEPTQGLDQAGSAAFYQLVATLRAEIDCAVLMVSHDLHVVMAATDRVICLNGHVCCAGSPAVVREAPEYRALFGSQTEGALALYRHEHGHRHDHPHRP